MLLTIGQLARRCGVPVRTIRFWSDEGVLPETDRSAGGYRRYDARAVARLDLVRPCASWASASARSGWFWSAVGRSRTWPPRTSTPDDPLLADSQVRVLRTHRAVCTLLARGAPTPRKAALMNDLARLSAAERRTMIDEFVDAAFAGIDPGAPGAGIANGMRTMPVELPDDPTTEQVQAWVELAELVGDPSFRARVREMATVGATASAAPLDAALVTEHADAALAAGVDPASAQGREVLDRIVPAGVDRAALLDTLVTFTDRRVERYWALLGVLNGWGAFPSRVPAYEWVIAALRAHP